MIYCQWVDEIVEKEKLGEYCEENIIDGRCIRCERSPQLDLGMKPSELLRNITKG
jgi:hypothetical protein